MFGPGCRLGLRVGLALLCLSAVRAWLVAGVGLGDDEAYYWTWSQHLDWSYFDHPGGIAWLIAASTAVFGDTPLGVRAPVVLSSAGLSSLLAWMSRGHGRRGVWLGALLGATLPVLGLMSVFSSPDLPMLLAWLGAVAVAEHLRKDTLRLWMLAGALVGITLLFKLTGALLAVGLIGWTLSQPVRRRWWWSTGPWLAVGTAVVVSTPTWAWNVVHDFPTLRFHAIGRHTHAPSWTHGLGLWTAAHLLLLLPTVGWSMLRSPPTPRRALLYWVAAPTWLVFTIASGVTAAKPHWWAPAWLTLLPLAVGWLVARPRHAVRVVVTAGALHLAVIGMARFPPSPLVSATAELQGWQDLAAELSALPPRSWVTPRYQSSAQLEWGNRAGPSVAVSRVGGRADQYTLWSRDQVPLQGPILLVCPSHLPCTPRDVPGLSCPQEPQRPATHRGGRVVRTFDVWTCHPSE